MEQIKDKLDEFVDEVLDQVALNSQVTDIHSNKSVIEKELLEADKKRWSIFRTVISIALLLITTVGYVYFGHLHTELELANRKIVVLEERLANLPSKETFLGIEKRCFVMETKLEDIATSKQITDLKIELMNLIIKLHHTSAGEK